MNSQHTHGEESAEIAVNAESKKNFSRILRILRDAFIFFSLVIITSFFLRPLQLAMMQRMTEIRDHFLSVIEEKTGRTLLYESMGPSIFATLDLRKVSLLRPDGSIQMSASRIRLRYSIFQLFKKRDPSAIKFVVIDRPLIHWDDILDSSLFSSDNALSENPQITESSDFTDLRALWPAIAGFRVSVYSGELRYSGSIGDFTVSSLNIQGRPRDEGLDFRSDGKILVKSSSLTSIGGAIASSFRVDALLPKQLEQGAITLRSGNISTDFLVVAPQTFLVSWSPEIVEIRKIQDKTPLDASLSWEFESQKALLSLKMESLKPADIVQLSDSSSVIHHFLFSRLSGAINLEVTQDLKPKYSVNLLASLPAWEFLEASQVEISAYGTDETLVCNYAKLTSSQGTVSFSGNLGFPGFVPDNFTAVGSLKLQQLALANTTELTSTLDIHAKGRTVSIFAEQFMMGGFSLSGLDATASFDTEAISVYISALHFLNPESYEEIKVGRLEADISFSRLEPFMQAAVSLESFPLGAIPSIFRSSLHEEPKIPILSDVLVSTELFFTTDYKQLSYNSPRFVAAVQGPMDVFMVTSIFGNNSRASLQDISVIWKGGSASGDIQVDFTELNDIHFNISAAFKDKEYIVEGFVLDGRDISINGNYDLNASLVHYPELGYAGSLQFSSLPIPLSSLDLTASLNTDFRWSSSELWSYNLYSFEVLENSLLEKRSLFVGFSSSGNQQGADLQNLQINDGISILTGNARLDWPNGLGTGLADISISNVDGSEKYDADCRWNASNIEARLYAFGAKIERFSNKKIEGTINGDFKARYVFDGDYNVQWALSSVRARSKQEDFFAISEGFLSPDVMELKNTRLRGGGLQFDIPVLIANRKASTIQGELEFSTFLKGKETSFQANIASSFTPVPSWMEYASAFKTMDVAINVLQMKIQGMGILPFEMQLDKKDKQIYLIGGPQTALEALWVGDGRFSLVLGAPAFLQARVNGEIRDGQIEAIADTVFLDFSEFWKVIGVPDLSFPSGYGEGSLRITGLLSDPEFYGEVYAKDFRVQVRDYVVEEIGPAEGLVVFNGNEFTFGPIDAFAGSGLGQVSGRFIFDRWIPDNMTIDIVVPSASPVLAKVNIAGIGGKGYANGNLQIAFSTIQGFSLNGALVLENTLITLNAGDMVRAGNSRSTSYVPVLIDLKLLTGRKVEFAWPTENYPILRAYANIGNSLQITANSRDETMSLIGDISLRGGEIFYFQRNFYVREGHIVFNENQDSVDPKLALRAEIRERYESEPVKISLIVDEAPIRSFSPRIESSPALSQAEIFTILGYNVTAGEGGDSQLQDAVISVSSDLLGQLAVMRLLEKAVRDAANLDMFSIKTRLLQNAIFGAVGIRGNQLDMNTALGNYFDNTTVYMGKFIGPNLFLQAMVSLQADNSQSAGSFAGVRLETDIGLEMNTPFFLLSWNFMPRGDVFSSDNLFIDDHSFTITWKKSF